MYDGIGGIHKLAYLNGKMRYATGLLVKLSEKPEKEDPSVTDILNMLEEDLHSIQSDTIQLVLVLLEEKMKATEVSDE